MNTHTPKTRREQAECASDTYIHSLPLNQVMKNDFTSLDICDAYERGWADADETARNEEKLPGQKFDWDTLHTCHDECQKAACIEAKSKNSTPAPSEVGDEEYFKRINYFVWNYVDREQRLTAESAFAQVLCDALNNARRTQNAEVERLKKEVEELKDIRDADTIRIDELRSLLERACDIINERCEGETVWLSDYEKLMGKKES